MKELSVTGVKFKRAGKIYDFLSGGFGEKADDIVVIEAEKGEDIATVVLPERKVTIEKEQDMKKVLRIATTNDLKTYQSNKGEGAEAVKTCREFAQKLNLDMKLLMAEYTLDKSKLTFYYTADNRVDFRQLVKDLAKVYRTRIDMRQIGVRDATKLLGGFGVCGRELCCCTFLRKFDNISIKTAKGQNVNMNPSKISGICGRLMCCLVHEKCGGCHTAQIEDVIIDMDNIIVENNSEGTI